MKYLLIIFFLILSNSCGYSDIDSVPKFENLKINKSESIDLCKLSNINNKKNLLTCLDEIN